jgi:uncharacterized membrane protein
MAAKANAFEKQALLSVAAGAVGLFATVGALAIILPRFEPAEFSVVMAKEGKAYPAVLAAVALACLAGAVGFFSGFSSAGNRRNSKSNLSWAGFFLSSAVLVLALSTFLVFWFAREIVSITPK